MRIANVHGSDATFNDSIYVDLIQSEDWKYGDPKALFDKAFKPLQGHTASTDSHLDIAENPETYKMVFINGVFAEALSHLADLPASVTLDGLAQRPTSSLKNLSSDANPVVALSTEYGNDGLYLDIPAGIKLDKPVELFFLTNEQAHQSLVCTRNTIRVGPGGELILVEHYMGPDAVQALQTSVTEIECGQGAGVRHIKLIRNGNATRHFGNSQIRQQADSRYTSREFAFGGQHVRRELHLDLDGTGAECDLTALYMAASDQKMDMRTRVQHNVPGCRTRELYKGLLDGDGRAVFDGLIKVAVDAQQTEAFQTNRNLLLSDDAVCYSIPRLEIYADDVKCSHGSTTGQLEDELMFFLRSRGFDAKTARTMLANAFASEIVEGIQNPHLRNTLTSEIAARLGADAEQEGTS